MDFSRLFQGISRKMIAEFSDVTEQIPHMGDRGKNREEIFKNFLEKHLPSKYGIGSGQAVSVDKQISKQLDCVIYAKSSCPLWYNESTQIFPAESVCSVIEIKSSLNKYQLEQSVENIRSVKRLPKLGGERPLSSGVIVSGSNPPTLGAVFSYSSNTSLETLRDNLNVLNKEIPVNERISLVCVLDQGILFSHNVQENRIALLPDESTTVVSVRAENDSFLLFFLLLSAYLNAIEVIPPNLLKYAEQIINQFRWETKQV